MPELEALKAAGLTSASFVTCKELKQATRKKNPKPLNVEKYNVTGDPLFCSFYDGATTTESRFMNPRPPVGSTPSSADWNGTQPVLKPGENGAYWEDKLWEVLSLNEGLRFNHGVGSMIETLNIVKKKPKHGRRLTEKSLIDHRPTRAVFAGRNRNQPLGLPRGSYRRDWRKFQTTRALQSFSTGGSFSSFSTGGSFSSFSTGGSFSGGSFSGGSFSGTSYSLPAAFSGGSFSGGSFSGGSFSDSYYYDDHASVCTDELRGNG